MLFAKMLDNSLVVTSVKWFNLQLVPAISSPLDEQPPVYKGHQIDKLHNNKSTYFSL